ncbi:BirA family transcriptional regulator [Novosphingobium sp. Rr 2-17]|uniref:biotin--[acetyl-CoA-carboxylase] ligase n=1 Tax=Novosphingobium sp. Rr 2-17 TaxID=555793 RepID=UPI0002699E82|nr:biotin--[acetyl-CoA-carboxylase] ligase [Novosphingobium sp. Rr 2-17]EIZ80274.1 BirA family transcriptional regulator [Novosphingobium sp. Rr 2-17]
MIRTVAQTGSTNADLAAGLRSGQYSAEGDWLVADRQTAGRGRLGRPWNDGFGNFMGSTVVRPASGDPPTASLALMAGVAVHESVSLFLDKGCDLRLKWPNDLMLNDGKLAGILLEMVAGVVIVGIGVNLAIAPKVEGRRTVALGDGSPGRDAFASTLASSFARELGRWRETGLAPLLRRWQSAAHPIGTPLMVVPPGEDRIEGAFAGLGQDGSLLLTLTDGSLRTIHAGDVLLADAAFTGKS